MQKTTTFYPVESILPEIERIFKKEKKFINLCLKYADIQHVGGTSLAGAITKKELDVQVRIPADKFKEAKHFFKVCRYTPYHEELWTETFAIFTMTINQIPVDVMITVIDGLEDEHHKIRDFLKENKDVLKKYNELKLEYRGKSYEDYTKAKMDFFGRHGKIKFLEY